MWLVFRGTEAAPAAEDGAFVLRHGRGLAIFGWVSIAAGITIAGASAFSFGVQSASDVLGLLGVLALFGGIGLLLLVAHRHEWVRVTTEGLEGRALFAFRTVRVAWEEVDRVRFSGLSGYLTVVARDGRRVRASAMMVGASHLGDLVERRFPHRGGPEAARRLRAFRAGHGG